MKDNLTSNNRIVITGLSGNIGHILYYGLKDNWEISGIDIKSSDLPVNITDITDYDSIRNTFDGAYAVIHLAANAFAGAEWNEIIGPNIIGTENVFRAAQQSGVRKIIFASSNHVTGLYENDEPYRSIVAGQYEGLTHSEISRIDHTMPIRPDGYYGISKAFGESLGRYYSERYGMRVFCIRIGTVNRENRSRDARQYATLLMHSDFVKLVEKCITDEDISFEIFYGVSRNTWRFWDINHIKDCLGWAPEENAEHFRE
jgi:nucleoside-diphosphate-sugar epimerase